jgi:hypothetical protein
MADVLRIKRRPTGAPGAPATLANAEIAYNEVDSTLYYGQGTAGPGGSATLVVPIAGSGAFVAKSGATMTGALVLVGVSTAPTAAPGTNTTQLATTAFVAAAIASLTAQINALTTRIARIESRYIATD